MISDEEADASLKKALDFVRTPHGTVDNVMRVHSLRPSTMNGHVTLYRACLHDDQNTIHVVQEVIILCFDFKQLSLFMPTIGECAPFNGG